MHNFPGTSFVADAGIDLFSEKCQRREGVFIRVEVPEGRRGGRNKGGGEALIMELVLADDL